MNSGTDIVRQRTIRTAVSLSGIALHTGNRVKLTLRPAPPDTGVRFRRLDLPGAPEVPALVTHVTDTRRGTTICCGSASVHTVEHLLAAVNALGLDNVMVDMVGPEPPVGDGSAVPFVDLLDRAGAVEQEGSVRAFCHVTEPVVVEAGEAHLILLPSDRFRISCTVKYNETPLDCQYLSLEITEASFRGQLQLARTFCMFHEIEALVKANLISGGSLDNAVVIKGDAILSKDGLRYADEFVRHKILDMVGDLFLLGCRLKGHVVAIKPGHPSNIELLRRFVSGARKVGMT